MVVPVGGAKGITAEAERPSRRPKRMANWGRTRPAFFSLSLPRGSAAGGERRVQRPRRSQQSGQNEQWNRADFCLSFFSFPRTEEVRSYIEPVALGQGCTGEAAQALDSSLQEARDSPGIWG
ncbi:hypothetical protein NDU88_004984 [Pleurodeles waltl]|uniref:Uncharacterized protein n=1 Tax=Pleurodeles waltl TaxID=8319 RepID=A0AAV7MWP9_PLEWA|nr:hypothetical protein NDU88_004984 [Pleurodeles waltl]